MASGKDDVGWGHCYAVVALLKFGAHKAGMSLSMKRQEDSRSLWCSLTSRLHHLHSLHQVISSLQRRSASACISSPVERRCFGWLMVKNCQLKLHLHERLNPWKSYKYSEHCEKGADLQNIFRKVLASHVLRPSSTPLPSKERCPSPKSYRQTSPRGSHVARAIFKKITGSYSMWTTVVWLSSHHLHFGAWPSHSSKEMVPLASVSNLSKNAFMASSSTASKRNGPKSPILRVACILLPQYGQFDKYWQWQYLNTSRNWKKSCTICVVEFSCLLKYILATLLCQNCWNQPCPGLCEWLYGHAKNNIWREIHFPAPLPATRNSKIFTVWHQFRKTCLIPLSKLLGRSCLNLQQNLVAGCKATFKFRPLHRPWSPCCLRSAACRTLDLKFYIESSVERYSPPCTFPKS